MGGTYKIQCFHHPTSQWFELHDLRVTPVLPQMVALTESYIQVYQRQDVQPNGEFGKFEMPIPEVSTEVDTGVAAEIEITRGSCRGWYHYWLKCSARRSPTDHCVLRRCGCRSSMGLL